MPSDVSICSGAFLLIGANPITDMNADSKEAKFARYAYPDTVDEVLRAGIWRCATKRAALAASATAPAFGYTVAYPLPNAPDYCLFVQATALDRDEGGDGTPWVVEGREILTTVSGPLNIRYTRRVVDPNLYDALLVSALEFRLAAKAALPLTKSRTLAADMWTAYMRVIGEAQSRSSQEISPAASSRRARAGFLLDCR